MMGLGGLEVVDKRDGCSWGYDYLSSRSCGPKVGPTCNPHCH